MLYRKVALWQLLMVTPGTQAMFEEIRHAAHKVEDSIIAQSLLDEANNAVNELSVKSTRRAGKTLNVENIFKEAQDQLTTVSLKLIEYATKQLALGRPASEFSDRFSEPLKVFLLTVKALDGAGPAELWCKEVVKPWQEVQCQEIIGKLDSMLRIVQATREIIGKLDSMLHDKALSKLNVIEDWFDCWAKSVEVRTKTCRAIVFPRVH